MSMKKTIEKLQQEHIERELLIQSNLESLIAAIIELNGQTFSQKKLLSLLPGDGWLIDTGCRQINVTNNAYQHFIGYLDHVLTPDYTIQLLSASRQRLDALKALPVDLMTQRFGSIQRHFNALCKDFELLDDSEMRSFTNPLYYSILKTIHNPDDYYGHSKIKMSDFYYLRSDNKKG